MSIANARAILAGAARGALVTGLLLLAVPVYGADLRPSPRPPEAQVTALLVLDGVLRAGPSRLRPVSFKVLSRYYCAKGRATRYCIRLAAQSMSSPDWRVRLLNLPNAFRPGMPEDLARRITTAAANDSSRPLRRAAAKLLAEHPEPWAREIVEKLSESPDPIVRVHAAAALVGLGQSAYARVLSHDMDGKDPEVALEAAGHLIGLQTTAAGRARTRIAVLFKDRDEVVRANVVYCLSELKQDGWSIGLIEQSVSDDSPLVRIAGISSLPRLGLSKTEAISLLGLISRRWPDEHVLAVRVDILEAVERLERQGALPREATVQFVSIAANGQTPSMLGCIATGILSFPNHRRYLDQLLTVAETPSIALAVRLIALAELGRSHNPDLAGPLFKFMKRHTEDSDRALQVASAAAIVSLNSGTRSVPAEDENVASE